MIRLEDLLYNAILSWFDETTYSYSGLDDPEFIESVCYNTGLTEKEYKRLILEEKGIREKIGIRRKIRWFFYEKRLAKKSVKEAEEQAKQIKRNKLMKAILDIEEKHKEN